MSLSLQFLKEKISDAHLYLCPTQLLQKTLQRIPFRAETQVTFIHKLANNSDDLK